MAIYEDLQGKQYDVEPMHVDWRIGVYACVKNEKNEILVVVPHWHDNYEFPGGGVEVKENIREGLLREVKEETGYDINVSLQPFYVGENWFHYVHTDKYFHSLKIIYIAHLVTEERDILPILGGEIKRVEWLPFGELTEQNFSKYHYPALSIIDNKYNS